MLKEIMEILSALVREGPRDYYYWASKESLDQLVDSVLNCIPETQIGKDTDEENRLY